MENEIRARLGLKLEHLNEVWDKYEELNKVTKGVYRQYGG